MSWWNQFDMVGKIENILSSCRNEHTDHHLGRPFMTGYQIAIAFAREHPAEFRAIDLKIGGRDLGERTSLSQQIARNLSMHIRESSPEVCRIEGGFLSGADIDPLSFRDGEIVSSVKEPAIFRYRG